MCLLVCVSAVNKIAQKAVAEFSCNFWKGIGSSVLILSTRDIPLNTDDQ